MHDQNKASETARFLGPNRSLTKTVTKDAVIGNVKQTEAKNGKVRLDQEEHRENNDVQEETEYRGRHRADRIGPESGG